MWIKICGIRDVPTALSVAEIRPDAIGLVFYEQSPRCVSEDAAAEIARQLPDDVEPIALFVNATADRIFDVCKSCGIRTIQLHGDEPPEFARLLQGLQVVRAFRLGEGELPSVASDLERYRMLGVPLRACLIDSRVEDAYGGTGHTAPWEALASGWQADWPPLILAGGLQPANVCEAVSAVRPWGIDVSSGVESSPGVKDLDRVAEFIANARSIEF